MRNSVFFPPKATQQPVGACRYRLRRVEQMLSFAEAPGAVLIDSQLKLLFSIFEQRF